ncbi:pyruvate dehydrogenase (acetyl-transferring) E1 component subunit alpha [Pseudomonas sp. MYb185]|uniref:pyruvate dehydrogenase (acetyl-transferring) E1 component subunit alpha n=1 Tax=Pseudomonas sp. MYb185 TaxID=1848729 RepID=UPI000CFCBDDC|nr:pyruvate dehydrogenase (acetyl-transferring) E1 component subunit alpha [Pseudomonas sp. MYb185]PRB82655.1 pyruvate dehydrogenase (acetyl-transferring) E1 component subunit alpha [Pseudomonas sp. MYb185]
MPLSVRIPYTRYLDDRGQALGELPGWVDDPELLLELYRQMNLVRVFDQKCIALQRTGQIGTYASTLGQEAVGTALGRAMTAEDVLIPYYRDTAVQLQRGVEMQDILLYWGGDERGSAWSTPTAAEDFPICVPIATQACHACGVASAFRIRQQPRVAVTTCGDGATSKGDFLESLNLAGVWQLPLVFVVNNNQWAISVPRSLQSAAPTLAHKALAAGIPGEQVDGNDVLAVYDRISAAIERARAGKGPTLVECVTYRLGDHTTSDDASRYRPAEELSEAWKHEPIGRLQRFLHQQQLWDERREQALQQELGERVNAAVEQFRAIPEADPGAAFDYLYQQLPACYGEQRDALLARAATMTGGEHG